MFCICDGRFVVVVQVQPVDISQVQTAVDNGLGSDGLANGDITSNAIYVATSDAYLVQQQQRPLEGSDRNANRPTETDRHSDTEGSDTDEVQDGESDQDVDVAQETCDSVKPETEDSKIALEKRKADEEEEEGESDSWSESEDQLSEAMDSTAVMHNGYMSSHAHGGGRLIPEPLDPRYHIGVHTPNGGFRDVPVGYSEESPQRSRENLYEDVEQGGGGGSADDTGPHREMAIDVPAGFVGSKKERPQYPSTSLSRPSPRSSAHGSPLKPYGGGDHASPDRRLPGAAGASGLEQPPEMSREEELQHLERIKKYQEDLRKRREEESRIAAENEFLRTSLRGSKKLQSLEELRPEARAPVPPIGIVNPNFVEEEAGGSGDASSGQGASRAATLPIRSPDYTAQAPPSEYHSRSVLSKMSQNF